MKLTQKLNEAAAVQDILPNTVRTYQHWARQFYLFNKLPASQWTGPEVTRWLCHLHRLNYSASSRKQALNAIAFVFKHVLRADMGKLELVVLEESPGRPLGALLKTESEAEFFGQLGLDFIPPALRERS